jgi:hypothetical protein
MATQEQKEQVDEIEQETEGLIVELWNLMEKIEALGVDRNNNHFQTLVMAEFTIHEAVEGIINGLEE